MSQLSIFENSKTLVAREIVWTQTNLLRWESSIGWLKLSILDDLGFYCLIVANDEICTARDFDSIVEKANDLLSELGKAIYHS